MGYFEPQWQKARGMAILVVTQALKVAAGIRWLMSWWLRSGRRM